MSDEHELPPVKPQRTPEQVLADRRAGIKKANEVRARNREERNRIAAEAAEAAARRDEMPEPASVEELGLNDLFSKEELAEIRKAAREKVARELKAEKKAELLAREVDRVRQERGLPRLRPDIDKERQARLNELVLYRVDLPEGSLGFRIDGQLYMHGVEYTVTRALYDTLRDIQYRQWDQEAYRLGQKRSYFNDARGRFEMNGGAPAGTRDWRVMG